MDLVEKAEQWGYERYWFAEHHGSASFASASPELLMSAATARTTRIRIGSGGILLGNASALRIAEGLRTLCALAPDRVDAGFGRAPGGDQRVAQALRQTSEDAYGKLDQVLAYLRNPQHPSNHGAIVAVPHAIPMPEVWVLGTTPTSAVEAARRGLSYAFGSFIDPTQMDEALAAYHANFVPGPNGSKPKTLIALVAFVGQTTQDAQRMARSSEDWFVQSFLRGMNVPFPAEHAPAIEVTSTESLIRNMRRASVLIGTASHVQEQLLRMQQRYATNEFAIVTITANHEDRCKSYQALAETFVTSQLLVP